MKLLITGSWSGAQDHMNELKEMGHEVIFMQWEKNPLPVDPAEIDGAICNGLFRFHDIKSFSSLKFIQLTSAGMDQIPVEYVREKNIRLYNAKEVYSIPMAEMAISYILQLYKSSRLFIRQQQDHNWKKRRNLL